MSIYQQILPSVVHRGHSTSHKLSMLLLLGRQDAVQYINYLVSIIPCDLHQKKSCWILQTKIFSLSHTVQDEDISRKLMCPRWGPRGWNGYSDTYAHALVMIRTMHCKSNSPMLNSGLVAVSYLSIMGRWEINTLGNHHQDAPPQGQEQGLHAAGGPSGGVSLCVNPLKFLHYVYSQNSQKLPFLILVSINFFQNIFWGI